MAALVRRLDGDSVGLPLVNLSVSATREVILGAGGAARAIIAAVLDAGLKELRLVNRTL